MKNHAKHFTITLLIFILLFSFVAGNKLLTRKETAFTYDELSKDLQKIEYVEYQEDIIDFVTIRTLSADETEYILCELCKIETSPFLGINPPFPNNGEKALILYYPDYTLKIRGYEISKWHFDSSKKNGTKYIRYNEDISNMILTLENV